MLTARSPFGTLDHTDDDFLFETLLRSFLLVCFLNFFVSASFYLHVFGEIMLFPFSFVFMSSMMALAFTLPHSAFDFWKGPKSDLESSGSGPNEPIRGEVKVFPLDPRSLAHLGFLRRGPSTKQGPSLPRSPFPAFLSQGRPGPAPALASKALVNPLHHLQPRSDMELKKKQGIHMWQKAMNKGETMPVSLPASLKDSKHTCSGVPFTQVKHFFLTT